MNRITPYLTACIILIFVFFACTDKEIILITNVDFKTELTHTEDGYVNELLPTNVWVIPEAKLPQFKYYFSYEVIKGEGNYLDESGENILAEGEKVLLDPEKEFSLDINYRGSSVGTHKVKIKTFDNFEKSQTYFLEYVIKDIDFVWQATSEVITVTSGERLPITITLQNKASNDNATFKRNYRFSKGNGKLINSEDEEIVLNKQLAIIPGSYTLFAVVEDPGQYEITFDVTDNNGQKKVQTIAFEVLEVKNEIPVITLNGNNPETVIVGESYVDPGVIAIDAEDGDISDQVVIESNVNVTIIGSYSVTYNVQDSLGEAGEEVTRTVNVVKKATAALTAIPDNGTVEEGKSITIAVVKNDENPDSAPIIITISSDSEGPKKGSVRVNSDNTITYTPNPEITNGDDSFSYQITEIADASNNSTAKVNISITEKADTTAPVITVTPISEEIAFGSTYDSKNGAVAMDNKDGDLTSEIVVSGTVNTMKPGIYTLKYNVSDAAGNIAEEKTRSVTVSEKPDTTAPVISITPIAQTISFGASYNPRSGVTAVDNIDGDITDNVLVTGAVNINKSGKYTLTYNVTDAAGNKAIQKTRTVTVSEKPDTTVPVITVTPTAQTISFGSSYNVRSGVTASDNKDGNITNEIVVSGSVNTTVPGAYTLRYNVTDAAGNKAVQKTRTVTVSEKPDTTAPVITVTPAAETISFGASYNVRSGVTASDNKDGNITSKIVVSGAVNTGKSGKYTLTYNVTDAAGNKAVQKTRTVTVGPAPDTTAPVITVTPTVQTIAFGSSYNSKSGVTAADNKDGNITSKIVVSGAVNTRKSGKYTLTYNVTDAAGNKAVQKTRTVTVGPAPDTTAPVITVTPTVQTIAFGSSYNPRSGVVANDNKDGNITSRIVVTGAVNTRISGKYTLTYNVTDAAGNKAVQKTRTVTVGPAPDTTAPVITVTPTVQTIAFGSSYNSKSGVTASDNKDGNITSKIVVSGSVNTGKSGNYTLTYNVTDAAGNKAIQKTRTVTVDPKPILYGLNETTGLLKAKGGKVSLGLWFSGNPSDPKASSAEVTLSIYRGPNKTGGLITTLNIKGLSSFNGEGKKKTGEFNMPTSEIVYVTADYKNGGSTIEGYFSIIASAPFNQINEKIRMPGSSSKFPQ